LFLKDLAVNFLNLSLKRRSGAFFVAVALPIMAVAGSGPSGVGNFQKVDDHVYRGAQPTASGFVNLSKLGIQTVIDLQEGGHRSSAEEKIVKAAGMHYISVPMKGMETPSNESIAKVLAVLENVQTGPVFVHCHRGADRTGGVIACYRIEHDHWQNDRALTEAMSMGMAWFQKAIQHYVLAYQPKLVSAGAAALASTAPSASPLAASLQGIQ
jgi:tyrosine-protein phosphatase SIW14